MSVAGTFEQSSSVYVDGAVYRYGPMTVDWTSGEIARLRAIKDARGKARERDFASVARLLSGVRRVCACCGKAKPIGDYYEGARCYCRECSRAKRTAHYYSAKAPATCR